MKNKISDNFIEWIVLFFKGIAVSFGFIVPGLSGGTMALIAGIYHKMLSSVSGIFKNFKSSALFLCIVGFGAVFGIFAFSNIISYLLNNFRVPITFFFMGCVAGGIPLLIKESQLQKKDFKQAKPYILIIIGAAIVIGIAILTKSYLNITLVTGTVRFLLFIAVGIFVAVALILPGISTTAFLEAIGIYQPTLEAIKAFDILYLLPIALGTILGIILTTKLFEILLDKKPQATYMIITGFVIGSFIEIFPGLPVGLDILWSVIMLALGVLLVTYLIKASNKKDSKIS